MPVPLVVNGATFNYPVVFDTGWGIDATGWAQAVTSGMLQKAGGSFPLTADVDFGDAFGLKALHLISETVNPAATGYIRLAKTDTIDFRNNANSADLPLAIDGSDNLTFNGILLATNGGGTVNAGTATHLAYYAVNGTALSDAAGHILSGNYVWSGTNQFNGTTNCNASLNANNGLSVTNSIGLAAGSDIVFNLPSGGTYRIHGVDTTNNWQYLIQDVGTNSTFVMTDGAQIIGGQKTFTGLILHDATVELQNQHVIQFDDATATGNVNLSAPNTVGAAYNLFLPTAQGAANSVLQNDGSGNLRFVTANVQNSSLGIPNDHTAITTKSITTTGGPVLIIASATITAVSVNNGGLQNVQAELDVTNGGASVAGARAVGSINGVATSSQQTIPFSIVAVDFPVAGTSTYDLTYNQVAGTSWSVSFYSLVLVELH